MHNKNIFRVVNNNLGWSSHSTLSFAFNSGYCVLCIFCILRIFVCCTCKQTDVAVVDAGQTINHLRIRGMRNSDSSYWFSKINLKKLLLLNRSVYVPDRIRWKTHFRFMVEMVLLDLSPSFPTLQTMMPLFVPPMSQPLGLLRIMSRTPAAGLLLKTASCLEEEKWMTFLCRITWIRFRKESFWKRSRRYFLRLDLTTIELFPLGWFDKHKLDVYLRLIESFILQNQKFQCPIKKVSSK